MKNLILTTTIILGTFALIGCGETAKNTTAVNATTNANSETVNTEKPPENVLKPGDIDLEKPVAADEVVAGVYADTNAWKGKEIAVSGYVGGTSGGGESYKLELRKDDKAKQEDGVVDCFVKGEKPENIFRSTVTIKGTVKETRDDRKVVVLEPCEVTAGGDDGKPFGSKTTSDSGGSGGDAATPTEAVKTFAAGMKDKDPSKVKSVLTAGSVKMLETGAKNDGEESLDAFIKSGKGGKQFALDGEFRNEKIDGDSATIEAKSNGKWEPITLAKENGNWKIAFDKR